MMQIKTEMLSEKQMRLRRLYYGDSDPFSRKHICSLFTKKRYVVFSETLKFYIERGMKVTKLHLGQSVSKQKRCLLITFSSILHSVLSGEKTSASVTFSNL